MKTKDESTHEARPQRRFAPVGLVLLAFVAAICLPAEGVEREGKVHAALEAASAAAVKTGKAVKKGAVAVGHAVEKGAKATARGAKNLAKKAKPGSSGSQEGKRLEAGSKAASAAAQ